MTKMVPAVADAVFRKGERMKPKYIVASQRLIEMMHSPLWRLFRALERGAEADLWERGRRK